MSDQQRLEWGRPDRAHAPIAWLPYLTNAVPLAMVLIWLVDSVVTPVSPLIGLGLYAAVVAALAIAFKPRPRR